MKYRDILGYSKNQPKKVVKEEPKPTVTDILKEQFGDTVNEGPAYEYSKYIKDIEKAFENYDKAVEKFELFLYRKKGLKKEASLLNASFHGYVGKFIKVFEKIVKGLL